MIQILPISSKGQVTIPLKARQEMGLVGKNKKVLLRKKDDMIVLEPISDDVSTIFGILKPYRKKNMINNTEDIIRQAKAIRARQRGNIGL
ncbi:MAG: AbrB/MazE/SpoVT family DNA-binding domain-containing protein [Patescibacteria group bacterium]|nr:AbrB/MazE/SpoVT family DNA-binding domain-containing protein [Patescibacteria group bacterium]